MKLHIPPFDQKVFHELSRYWAISMRRKLRVAFAVSILGFYYTLYDISLGLSLILLLLLLAVAGTKLRQIYAWGMQQATNVPQADELSFDIELDETGIKKSVSDGFRVFCKWDVIHTLRESPLLFTFFIEKSPSIAIPKEHLNAEQIAEIRSMATRQGLVKKGRLWSDKSYFIVMITVILASFFFFSNDEKQLSHSELWQHAATLDRDDALEVYERLADDPESPDSEAAFKIYQLQSSREQYPELYAPVDAVLWLEKASDIGNYRADMELASLYRDGRFVDKDLDYAIQLWEMYPDAAECLLNLGLCLRDGNGMKQDTEQALIRFYKAWLNRPDNEDMAAEVQKAIASIPQKEREDIMTKGQENQMTWAMLMQVDELQKKGDTESVQKSFELLQQMKIVPDVVKDAYTYHMGMCYLHGWGTPANKEEAIKYFMKSYYPKYEDHVKDISIDILKDHGISFPGNHISVESYFLENRGNFNVDVYDELVALRYSIEFSRDGKFAGLYEIKDDKRTLIKPAGK